MVRAEERLRDRWAKLQLGYWRRIFEAHSHRLLRTVIDFRVGKRKQDGAFGSSGWLPLVESTFVRVGLEEFWTVPGRSALMHPDEWKTRVAEG